MKMTTEEARNLGMKAVEDCSNTEPDAAFQIIADAIFYACQAEADSLQAAIEAEREACASAVPNTSSYGCGSISEFAFKAAKNIRARGTTSALDEELRKARLKEAKWWMGHMMFQYGAKSIIEERLASLQTPEGKEGQ